VLDLIWGIPTLETADPVVFQDMRTLASLLINGETMACTEKLRVLLQSSLGRTRSVSRLISINLENIPGHLRGRSPASASSAGVSRHSRLRKAWLPWRVSRLGTPPPGWRMTARSRSEFRHWYLVVIQTPTCGTPFRTFFRESSGAVRPRVKILTRGEESFASI
jgi:hypothetical protein